MSQEPSELPDAAPGHLFPETHWSRIFNAGNLSDPLHLQHLDRLLRAYWKPICHYVRAMRNVPQSDAEDLTQGFFTMVLERVHLDELKPELGSFRGFLKTALRRFVISEDRKKRTRSTVDQVPRFELDADDVPPEPDQETPETAFDRQWVRDVLQSVLVKLETDLAAEGKQLYFDLFTEYRLATEPDGSYQQLALRHRIKEDDVRNHLRAARKRARSIAREIVSVYALPGEDIEAELRFVLSR